MKALPVASATIEPAVESCDLMVQPSLTRRDDEPRCYRALKRTAKVKSRYAAGEMHSAPRAEIWVKTSPHGPGYRPNSKISAITEKKRQSIETLAAAFFLHLHSDRTHSRRDLMTTKQQDLGLILKLYELRRDEMMRRARNWYVTEFQPQSAKDIIRLMLSGQEQSAYSRMVTSYWDMAESLVNNGGID